LTLTFSNVALV